MINLEYNGNNTITFGKYKIAKGINQIDSDDFDKFMLLPHFAIRVNTQIFKIHKKEVLKNIETNPEEKHLDKVYVSGLVGEIKKMDNLEKLYAMLDTDKRSRVQKALIERIEEIG